VKRRLHDRFEFNDGVNWLNSRTTGVATTAQRRIASQADRSLYAWRRHSGADDAKLALVAHVMGRLVAPYFLEVLTVGGTRGRSAPSARRNAGR
jgi:hypothetical protein